MLNTGKPTTNKAGVSPSLTTNPAETKAKDQDNTLPQAEVAASAPQVSNDVNEDENGDEEEELQQNQGAPNADQVAAPKPKQQAVLMPNGLKVEFVKPSYEGNGQFNFNLQADDLKFKTLNDQDITLPDARKQIIAKAVNKIEENVLKNFIDANRAEYKIDANNKVTKSNGDALNATDLAAFETAFNSYRETNINSISKAFCSEIFGARPAAGQPPMQRFEIIFKFAPVPQKIEVDGNQNRSNVAIAPEQTTENRI